MFASSSGGGGNARPTTMIRIWVVAAVALVAGILIGFASGFTAGKRASDPGTVAAAAPAASDRSASPGQSFSEAAVPPALSEPAGRVEGVRVEDSPAVPEPVPQVKVPALSERAPRAKGPERPARVEREPAVAPAATGPGSIQVVSRPSGAQVILDGRSVGRTPLTIPELPNGTHDVRLDLPGFRRWATSIQINPGQRTRVAASLEQ